jgi:hypothetical protein
MKKTIPLLLATLIAAPVFAQSLQGDVNRDLRQQQRIESGLKSGQLTTREAARLEREEAGVERAEAKASRDGTISAKEQARITRMENKVSADIKAEKHDGQVGNPNAASSQRMQADVQRNINQQQRIANGLQDGSLTNREAGKLERGQARTERLEARAGANGHVSAAEQARVQRSENHQSRRIHRERHDGQHG